MTIEKSIDPSNTSQDVDSLADEFSGKKELPDIGSPSFVEELPGQRLSPEQHSICRRHRELRSKFLSVILPVQGLLVVLNLVAGIVGFLLYQSDGDSIPFPAYNIFAVAMIGLSLPGTILLKKRSVDEFGPIEKIGACNNLTLLQVPLCLLLFSSMLPIVAYAEANVFLENCGNDLDIFHYHSIDCNGNSNPEFYRAAAVFSAILLCLNSMLALSCLLMLFLTKHAFNTNQMEFDLNILGGTGDRYSNKIALDRLVQEGYVEETVKEEILFIYHQSRDGIDI